MASALPERAIPDRLTHPALGGLRPAIAGPVRGHGALQSTMLAVGASMFIPRRTVHLMRNGPRRLRVLASIRARAALAATQPGAHRLRRLARAALVAGVVAIVLSLVPGWLGYQPLEDTSGGLALVNVAAAADGPAREAPAPALVVPIPHLASIVVATGSMPGRLTLLTIPALALFAASLLQRAGRQWPPDRLPSLQRATPAAHRSSFPQGPAPVRRARERSLQAPPAPSRPGFPLLAIVAVAFALVGVFGRRPQPRG